MSESKIEGMNQDAEEYAFRDYEALLRVTTTEEVAQLLSDPSQAKEYIDYLVKKDLKRTKQINKLVRDVIAKEALGKTGFDERLLIGVKRAQEAGGMISVGRGDLDNFKIVNAKLGHDGADRILYLAIMSLVNSVRREGDTIASGGQYIIADDLRRHPDQSIAAREHGDELAVVLPSTTTVAAMSTINKAQRRFLADVAREFPNQVSELNTSMSFGVMTLDFSPIPGRQIPTGTPEQLVEMLKQGADDALYVVKETKKGSILPYHPQDPRILARQAARR